MFISQRCVLYRWSAVFRRCRRRRRLPPVHNHRLPPGCDPWHEQCRDFGCDILPPSTKMFVWSPAFLSEPGSARYSSTPSLTTVWSDYQTSHNNFVEDYITKNGDHMCKRFSDQFNYLDANHVTSHSSFSLPIIGQSPHSWRIPLGWP